LDEEGGAAAAVILELCFGSVFFLAAVEAAAAGEALAVVRPADLAAEVLAAALKAAAADSAAGEPLGDGKVIFCIPAKNNLSDITP